MRLLIDGQWHDRWYANRDGRFEREQSKRHDWITPDGSPGPKGKTGYPAEAGRYHLYVSLACPWAHRTLIYRKLKELESLIDVSVVSWLMRLAGIALSPLVGLLAAGMPLPVALLVFPALAAAGATFPRLEMITVDDSFGGWAMAQLWLFWVAPLIGGALGGVIYRWLSDEPTGVVAGVKTA